MIASDSGSTRPAHQSHVSGSAQRDVVPERVTRAIVRHGSARHEGAIAPLEVCRMMAR
jgi:hypothetical protein